MTVFFTFAKGQENLQKSENIKKAPLQKGENPKAPLQKGAWFAMYTPL